MEPWLELRRDCCTRIGGASSTLVGLENFKMNDADGVYVEWVTRLVDGLDDIDVPLFSKILRAILEGRAIEATDLIA